MADYQLVFDITQAGYRHWTFAAPGLIFVAAGAVLCWKREALANDWWRAHPRAYRALCYFLLTFASLWTVGSFASTFLDYRHLAAAVRNGAVQVAEGPVTRFHPMPASDRGRESFCVREQCFAYSDNRVTAGFNNTSSHGGPIREGLPVRVTYLGGDITRLEVARNP